MRAALAGKTADTGTRRRALQEIKQDPEAARDPVTLLTPRQRGNITVAEAGRLRKLRQASISARTAEFYKYKLMETRLHTNSDLTHFAIKHGIVSV
jgi:hypothetical protein